MTRTRALRPELAPLLTQRMAEHWANSERFRRRWQDEGCVCVICGFLVANLADTEILYPGEVIEPPPPST